jgi:hypothetical protein
VKVRRVLLAGQILDLGFINSGKHTAINKSNLKEHIMSIKTIILAAAVAATGSFASAESYFEHGRTLDADDTLELGLVRSESAGLVEIYDFHKGVQGKLLGSERVRAGANTDVRVHVGFERSRDVLAVISIDGQAVASKVYEIDPS